MEAPRATDGSAIVALDLRGMVEGVRHQCGNFIGKLLISGFRRGKEESFTVEIVHTKRHFISRAPTLWEAGQNMHGLYNDVLQKMMGETLDSLEGGGPCEDQVY